MLNAATAFAKAFNDSRRVEQIAVQVETCIEEIIQHRNLLERQLIDQLEEIARQRADWMSFLAHPLKRCRGWLYLSKCPHWSQ